MRGPKCKICSKEHYGPCYSILGKSADISKRFTDPVAAPKTSDKPDARDELIAALRKRIAELEDDTLKDPEKAAYMREYRAKKRKDK